ncbi:polysaccharide deacetylase family protein [Paenibacillus sp. BR2-3]|uniref:polysaccharide deacetylase family protein n=1 Tax=Paenibacillus sp. BR2-3 TaxID=3048494 RepID=UPI0039776E6D
MSHKLLGKVLFILMITSIIACFPPPSSRAVPVSAESFASTLHEKKRLKKKSLTISQLLRKYPETIKTRGPRIKALALTFDDVPDPRFTPQLLDVLHKYHIKATFFVVGSRAQRYPALVTRMVREGHIIGNHSYNHSQFTRLRMNAYKSQIIHTENIIKPLAGYKPKLIRPPYGDISEAQLRWAKANGYKLINWNVDSLDWRSLSKTQVKANILSQAGRGSIILQHGGGGRGSDLGGSIQALPEVISYMRERGYTFVTVPELLHISPYK